MRLAFMGTPDFAVPALAALVEAGHEVAAVYTQPARPAQRGQAPQPSPVARAAAALGLALRTPASLRAPPEPEAFTAIGAEAAVVAAYGLILPAPILNAPARGCFNIHASLLPRWRGAAPVQRAILAGDAMTGVTIMRMERGLDTGPTLLAEATSIGAKTAGALTEELADMGARLMVEALERLDRLTAAPQPVEGVTLAPKIDKAEARLDWNLPATALERAVRAFNPWPGAWTELKGERLKLLAVEVVAGSGPPGVVLDDRLTIACGEGALLVRLAQRPGRPALDAAALLRGWPVAAGTPAG
jgi:methionyl-tRNA formyltransferase